MHSLACPNNVRPVIYRNSPRLELLFFITLRFLNSKLIVDISINININIIININIRYYLRQQKQHRIIIFLLLIFNLGA